MTKPSTTSPSHSRSGSPAPTEVESLRNGIVNRSRSSSLLSKFIGSKKNDDASNDTSESGGAAGGAGGEGAGVGAIKLKNRSRSGSLLGFNLASITGRPRSKSESVANVVDNRTGAEGGVSGMMSRSRSSSNANSFSSSPRPTPTSLPSMPALPTRQSIKKLITSSPKYSTLSGDDASDGYAARIDNVAFTSSASSSLPYTPPSARKGYRNYGGEVESESEDEDGQNSFVSSSGHDDSMYRHHMSGSTSDIDEYEASESLNPTSSTSTVPTKSIDIAFEALGALHPYSTRSPPPPPLSRAVSSPVLAPVARRIPPPPPPSRKRTNTGGSFKDEEGGIKSPFRDM